MLEVYSLNVEVAENSAIPLNNVSIQKGCTAVNSAPATIQLDRCGVYMVSCDCSAVPEDAGLMAIQMYKNGVAQPQAQASSTGETGDTTTMGFQTLVQVSENNTNCCCSSPTLLQIFNVGVEATYSNINVCVTKIC